MKIANLILTVAFLVFLLFALSRLAGATIPEKNVIIIVDSRVCDMVEGSKHEGACRTQGDLSYDFFTGEPVISLASGKVVHLRQDVVIEVLKQQ